MRQIRLRADGFRKASLTWIRLAMKPAYISTTLTIWKQTFFTKPSFAMLKKLLFFALLLSAFFFNESYLSAQLPTPINYGQSIVGNLPLTSSTASYTTPFAQSGDVLMVRAVPTGLMHLKVELYAPSGQLLMSYFANADYIVHLFYTIPSAPVGESGSYKMIVSNTDGFFTGNFCIFLQRVNESPNTLFLNCNTSLSDDLDCISSFMSLRYVVQQGAVSRITINPNGLSAPEAWLCASDGTILRYGLSDNGEALIFDTISALYTDCYYIFVTDFGAFFTTGGFNVSHTLLSGDCAAPIVQTMPPNGNVCAGSPFSLSASSPLPDATYAWSGPNGFTSSQAQISFPEAADSLAGAYIVSVTVPNVCSSVLSQNITVNPLPTVSASVNPASGVVCEGTNFMLNVMTNATSPVSYQWSKLGGGFSSTQKSPIISNPDTSKSGIYVISVTDGKGCVKSDSIEVTINPLPSATISSPASGAVCLGATLLLNATTNALNATFSWSGPGGFTSSIQNPIIQNVTFSYQGTYNVTVTDMVTGCSKTASKFINVNNLPSADISGDLSICLGQSTVLTATGGGTYAWSNGQNTASTTVSPSQTTAYTVTVTNASTGCTDSESDIVTVIALPSISATSIPTNPEICSGEGQILLCATSADAVNPTWKWTATGFSSSQQCIVLTTPQQSGIYTAVVTDGNTSCSSAATPISVNIHPTPTVSILQTPLPPYFEGDDITLCAPSDATGASYNWAGPNNFSGTMLCATVNNVSISQSGIYSVTVTDIHGCKGFANAEIVVEVVSIVEPDKAWELRVGPNPSNGIVQIWTEKPFHRKLEIIVFDANGCRIRDLEMETPTLTLNMTDLPIGLYVLRISDGEKIGTLRLVVSR